MIALLVLVAAVVVVLEWNRRRPSGPPGHPGVRPDLPDRDRDRLLDDLRAVADRT
ncbi:hypothetical protein [Kribbella sp. ALI-6-A]|uniref:hypothetical protein n=1 Tax=Kribbella sp. ALI-6-A TaxID=1933817 RepID=UPI00143D9873|nr:hypothetical protein [Kribbella sp. ALI-6-A]